MSLINTSFKTITGYKNTNTSAGSTPGIIGQIRNLRFDKSS